jgi:hypothetical protein
MLNCLGFGIINMGKFYMEEPMVQVQRREQMEQIVNKLLKGNKTNIAKAVFLFLLSKVDHVTGTSCCSIPTISEYTRYSEVWVKAAINLCITTGLITKAGRGVKGSAIAYRINYVLIEEGE